MSISVNWITKVISVPKAYTQLVQADPEIREMSIDTFRLDLRDLEDDEEGITFLPTHSHNTEVTFGGVTLARVVEIINGYTITFEDGQWAVNVYGANSNIADITNVNQVSIRTANSAGLIKSLVNEDLIYAGIVHIDTVGGEAGTDFPIGSVARPVNNITDARTIADKYGIFHYHVIGNITLNANYDGWIIQSNNSVTSIITLNNQSIEGARFNNVSITGQCNGDIRGHNLEMYDVTNIQGEFFECGLSGNFSVKTGDGTKAYFFRSFSQDLQPMEFDMNGNGILIYYGTAWITVKNLTSANGIAAFSGDIGVTIDSTVTDGYIYITGDTVIDADNKTGGTVVTSYHNISKIYEKIKELRETNKYYEFVEATVENATRKVAVGVVDSMIIKYKKDDDVDWSSPIKTETLYCWYKNIGDTDPMYVRESD